MTYPWWFSRLRSSSKTIYSIFQTYTTTNTTQNAVVSGAIERTNPFRWRFNYLVPISAASLLLHVQPDSSFSDPHDPMSRCVGNGGKGSTEFVVKGSYMSLPQELIEDLKGICGENFTMDYDERFFHGKPQNSFHKAVNIPDIVLFPKPLVNLFGGHFT